MRSLIILFFAVLVAGCSTSIKHYENTTDELKLEQFFDGKLTAYGIVQSRSGAVLRRFKVDMIGQWEDDKGTLDEQFYYHDGERQHRVWHLTKTRSGHYTGHADDAVTNAWGEARGFALNWNYTLSIPVDGQVWDIDFDDWMYMLDEKRLINRAEMKKWGFRVGEVILWIEKHE